jgi:hypothetical protein
MSQSKGVWVSEWTVGVSPEAEQDAIEVAMYEAEQERRQVLADEQALVPPGWGSVDGGVVDDEDAVCCACGRLQDTCWCHVRTSAWHRTEGGAA